MFMKELTTCDTMISGDEMQCFQTSTHLGADIADETQQYSCIAHGVCRVDAQSILENCRHEDEQE